MARIRTIVTALAFLCLAPTATALRAQATGTGSQADDARTTLDRTAAAYQANGGVKAAFRVTGGPAGTISLQGDRFRLATDAMTTWFDGATQWTYLTASDEVTVSTPTADELQTLNPYAWLSLYKDGYDLSRRDAANEQGAVSHVVTLTRTTAAAGPAGIVLTIDARTLHLQQASIALQAGGETVDIRISSYTDHIAYTDAEFRFPTADYPTAEIIDLR